MQTPHRQATVGPQVQTYEPSSCEARNKPTVVQFPIIAKFTNHIFNDLFHFKMKQETELNLC